MTPIALHLRPGVREVFMDWLEAKRPDLVDRYGELYGGRSYAPADERRRLAGLVRDGQRRAPSRVRAERFLRRRSEAIVRPATGVGESAAQTSLF